MQVNIRHAKTCLSRLIERALQGEEIIIAKAGRPVVRLTALPPRSARRLGAAIGRVSWQEGWEQPLTPAELEDFLR